MTLPRWKVYILCLLMNGTACADIKQPNANSETNVTFEELAGVWGMSDGKKMHKFLNAKDEGAYCMEVRPAEGKARVRFLFSEQTYEVGIKEIGAGKFLVTRNAKTREAVVARDFTDLLPGTTIYSWHFADSKPFPNKDNSTDGVKERHRTLEEAVRAAEKEEEATPLNEDNPFE